MATRTLSQKTIEKHRQAAIAKHHEVVMMLARSAAKKVIKSRLREQGVRLTLVLPKDINAPAYDYLAEHRQQLIAEAEHTIATSSLLKRWRLPCAEISSDEQKQSEPISTTSTVHMSGSEWRDK